MGGGAREIGGEAWARWIVRSGALLLSGGASRETRERGSSSSGAGGRTRERWRSMGVRWRSG